MVEFKKKNGESFENFLRRSNRAIQRSGKLLLARRLKYFQPKLSKAMKKESALKRVETGKEKEYLRKLGKIE